MVHRVYARSAHTLLLLLAGVCSSVEYRQAVNGHVFTEQLKVMRREESFEEVLPEAGLRSH